MRNKWITRFITIILSALSFAFFALFSCLFTYDKYGVLARGYIDYAKGENYKATTILLDYSNLQSKTYEQQTIDIKIVEQSGVECIAYGYSCNWFCGVTQYGGSDKSNASPSPAGLLATNKDGGEILGLDLLAGRFPANIYEIAIAETQFDYFLSVGYSYNFKNFVFDEEEGVFEFDSLAEKAPIQKIESYKDIIGKKLAMYGNPDKGTLGTDSIFEVEIVGVVNTHYDQNKIGFEEHNGTANNIVIAKEWRVAFPQGDAYMGYMYLPVALEYKTAKECAKLTFELQKLSETMSAGRPLGVLEMALISLPLSNPDPFFSWVGAFFGIFAVALNAYLMTALMEKERKQIGILRAMGASKKRVCSIYIIGTLVFSIFIFFAAFITTIGLYYGYLRPSTMFNYKAYIISPYVFNGWTVLILAGISFLVPVLSVLLPLHKFLKRSIVDTIRGNDTKKEKKR